MQYRQFKISQEGLDDPKHGNFQRICPQADSFYRLHVWVYIPRGPACTFLIDGDCDGDGDGDGDENNNSDDDNNGNNNDNNNKQTK